MSARVKANRELLCRIERIHGESHETYGSPKVWAALRKEEVMHGEKRVAQVMRWAGLRGRGKHRVYFVSIPFHSCMILLISPLPLRSSLSPAGYGYKAPGKRTRG